MVLGNNSENLPQLIKIFSRIYESEKLSTAETNQ